MKTRSDQKKEEAMGQAVSDEPAHATLNAGEVQERIAMRAYELYRERGAIDGYDLDDWLEAEQIIIGSEAHPERGILQ
ncbi:MAG TPA: hypothetical protein DEA71_06330 [Nitrospira sp.]|jgi:hypothetical protein|nr:hypothetical protein [Nitrospira sp.]